MNNHRVDMEMAYTVKDVVAAIHSGRFPDYMLRDMLKEWEKLTPATACYTSIERMQIVDALKYALYKQG